MVDLYKPYAGGLLVKGPLMSCRYLKYVHLHTKLDSILSGFCTLAYTLTLHASGEVSLNGSGVCQSAAEGNKCVAVACWGGTLAIGFGTSSWPSLKVLFMEICNAFSATTTVSV